MKISLLAYMALTANATPVEVAHTPTVSPFPFTQSEHPIVLTIVHWPQEIEWSITGKTAQATGISCTGTKYDGHYGAQPAIDCPLKQGKYELKCIDTASDGWHGGYLTIDGKNYCDDFHTGHEKVEEFQICHDPLPITQK